jgi:hypothetical protein
MTLFGNQLFGLIQRSKSTDKTPQTSVIALFGSDLNFLFGRRKQNECFIACQNSRLSMWHKINDLVFSNSTVAFKTNYLMLNNLL